MPKFFDLVSWLLLALAAHGQPVVEVGQLARPMRLTVQQLQWQPLPAADSLQPGLGARLLHPAAPANQAPLLQQQVAQLVLRNSSPQPKQVYLRLPYTWQAALIPMQGPAPQWSGKQVSPLQKPVFHYQNMASLTLLPGQQLTCYLSAQAGYSLLRQSPLQVTVYSAAQYEAENSSRHFWQAIFIGIIIVMGLYNLFLFFAVKDASYLHYVLSIAGIGFYFAYYYGFAIEYLWPRSPRWDLWCYTLIVPATSLSRLWFTRTYLHSPGMLPGINRAMNVLAAIMMGTLLAGLITYLLNIDWLAPLVNFIGITNTLVLVIMLVAGIQGYRQGYRPAFYFMLANAPLVAGAILFILREVGLIGDSWMTRYFVQIGVVIQVVLFALGLASRYNQTRLELEQQRLEKERLALETEKEKKQLIEDQRRQLEKQVEAQTQSLRQKNEKLQELNSLKDKLFSVITHDLRNPLATMQSFLKLLTEHHEKLSEEEKHKLVQEAQDSLDHLNRLLFHLLQWSKSQMNLLSFQPQAVAVKELIDKSIRVLHLQAHLKHVSIRSVADGQLRAWADEAMLDFVIRNLLSNAIKFSRPNGMVTISAWQEPQQVVIEIADEGIGMHAGMVQEILTTHVGATRRGTAREKGTGLGLLISREFVEKHGGRLDISSQPQQGTRVRCLWPIPPHQQAAKKPVGPASVL